MKVEKRFLLVGQQYLHTSKLLLEKIVETGNRHVIVSNSEINWDEYEKATEYSDFNIIIPTLFIFYHGLELIVKGMIKLHGDVFKTEHSFEGLLIKLKSLDQSTNVYLDIISKYVEKPLKIGFLNGYMLTENIDNIHDLYMSFRYPSDKSLKKFYDYFDIQYKENKICSEINEISIDINNILIGTVKVYHDICDREKK